MNQIRSTTTDPFANCSAWPGLRLVQHGLTLQLQSNAAALIAYAADHFAEFATPMPAISTNGRATSDDSITPEIVVHVRWIEPDEAAPAHEPFGATDDLQRIGRRIYSADNLLLWLAPFTVENLQYRFRLAGTQLIVDAIYHFSPTPGKTPAQLTAKRLHKFFSLMKHLLIFPMTWYLEQFRNTYLLHAAAVSQQQQAIAIAGVGGVGKTTTCLALLNQPETQLMAENLIYYDQHRLYSCYEPIRVDAHSLQLLGTVHPALRRSPLLPMIKEKAVYHLPRAHITEQAPLRAFFLPRFAAQTRLLPIAPALAIDKILAMNMQTREVNAYYWFAATLALVWPKAGRAGEQLRQLEHLLADVPLWELEIAPDGRLQSLVDLMVQQGMAEPVAEPVAEPIANQRSDNSW
jgi:hypothetical protein